MMRRRRQNERGSSIVEFALSFSLIFVVFTGAYEFGYAFCAYNTLQEAVRAGARYAATRTYNGSSCSPIPSAFSTAVKNVTVYGTPNPANGAAPIFSGLTTDKVNVSIPACAGGVPLRITVAITGFRLTPGIVPIPGFTGLTTNNKPNASFVYEGVYAPI